MLQTVRDACQFDPKAIDYALSDQIESLEDLVGHEPGAGGGVLQEDLRHRRHADPAASGAPAPGRQDSGQAVFELKQAMGGGKTHSMLALGYLGANPALPNLVPKEISRDSSRRRRGSSRSPGGRSRATSTLGRHRPATRKGPGIRGILQGQPKGAEREGLAGADRRRADPDPARRTSALFRLRRDPNGRRRNPRRRHGLRALEPAVGGAQAEAHCASSSRTSRAATTARAADRQP